MTKKERLAILEKIAYMNDEELEKQAMDKIFDCLGSQVDDMYELGYDMVDIIEREKYERYLCEVADIYGQVAEKRGINLWEREGDDNAKE